MIYTNAFILSMLGLTVAASGGKNQKKMNDYLGFVGKFEKSYGSNGEFTKRLGQYLENDNFIEECNWNADHTDEHDPVHCGHNEMSDWTQEEYEAILGFDAAGEDESEDEDASFEDPDDDDMLGIALATTVDHTPLMTPVKS
jgi:hypothetical protein